MNKKDVVLEDVGETKQFGMLVNAKSFGIIVNGIYSHKIRAVIREYTTNCIDSHLQAGHSKSYDCHLPTQNNPTFYVRDYGVGLDEEDIVNVFTVAFASTKENSALTTGNLGIGAMSAFCYNSKSFTVTSWKNGTKYIYHMYLDATDAPCYTKMLEEKSDEPTGVKVEFPVYRNDIWKFDDEAENVFKWQDVKPNLISKQVDIYTIDKSFSGDGWYLTNVKNCSVLMGGVLYDVEAGETTLAKFNDYINSRIVIEAPIGSVDFQPSRERLQYTQKTISFLRKMFLNISREVLEKFDTDVKNAKTLWDARTCLSNMVNTMPSNIHKLVDLTNVEWNGIKLHQNRNLEIFLNPDDTKDLCEIRTFDFDRYRKSPRENGNRRLGYCVTGEYINLVVCDVTKGVISKVKYWIQNTSKKTTILFQLKDGKTIADVKKYIIDTFSCDDSHIILSSSLPDPPKVVHNRTKLSSISLWYNSWRPTSSWIDPQLENVDITSGVYYYVARHAYDYINKNTDEQHRPKELQELINYFNSTEKTTVKIYGVAKRDVKDLPDNWIEFTSLVGGKLNTSVVESQKYVDDLDYYYSIVNLDSSYDYAYNCIKDLNNKLDKSHPLLEWYNRYKTLKNIKKPVKPAGFDLIKKTFNIIPKEQKLDFDCSVVDKYKLLKQYRSSYYVSVDPLDFYHYILGVDAHG